MTAKKAPTCGVTIEPAHGRTLTCILPEGHSGPVHEDASGEQWGDMNLPAREVTE